MGCPSEHCKAANPPQRNLTDSEPDGAGNPCITSTAATIFPGQAGKICIGEPSCIGDLQLQ